MSKNKDNRRAAEAKAATDEEIKIENPDVEAIDDIPDEEGEEIEAEKDIINKQLDELSSLQAQLEESKAKIEKEKNEYLYLMAEFDNYRKRTVKEKSDIIKNASEKAIKDLLPIVDDFSRAIEANRESEDAESIKEGTELIYNKLMKYLEKNDVKPIESTGKEFNDDYHEAVAMVPTGDENLKGKVIDTLTTGYTMGDRVIRHAKVAVGQ